jgi:selenocysteine-specific elongation factor
METIGGGRVLQPNALRIRKATPLDIEMIKKLTGNDPKDRASASVYLSNDPAFASDSLSRTAGLTNGAQIFRELVDDGQVLEVKLSVTRTATIHRQRFELLADRVVKVLERLHEMNPLRFNHSRQLLNAEFSYLEHPALLDAVVMELKNQNRVVLKQDTIALVGFGPKLSKGEKQLIGELIETVKSHGLTPVTVKELIQTAKKNKESVPQLLNLAFENGDLVKITDDMYVHVDILEEAKTRIAAEINRSGGLTMSEIRQILDVSRKYSVPICEHLDSIGFTERSGDKRLLGSAEVNAT